jgi:hypothetical protein
LPQVDQSKTSEEHYGLEQLNPVAEIFLKTQLQATKVHTSRRYLRSSPTNKNDKLLDLIGD